MLQNCFSTFLGKTTFSSAFKTLNLKNSLKLSFSAFGSIKKRFLMVKSCLEHISKLILIGKSFASYMYSMYVFHICILCMYSTHEFMIFVCKASWLSRPLGAKIHENSTCETKLCFKSWFDVAKRKISSRGSLLHFLVMDVGAFCVELWSLYCSKRIPVLMSYIYIFIFII